MRENNNDRPIE